jgi:hypothetical protein
MLDELAFTAQVRIAPKASRIRLMTIPIALSVPGPGRFEPRGR